MRLGDGARIVGQTVRDAMGALVSENDDTKRIPRSCSLWILWRLDAHAAHDYHGGVTHAPVYPHDPIEEVLPDVFMVRGSIRFNAFMRISRNMAILRHAGELTLVNPIRLNEDEEQNLRSLGQVKHIFRLGPFHGLDDAYYVDRFGAELWTAGESKTYPEPKADATLTPGADLPVPDTEVITFAGTRQPEIALLCHRNGGLLLTCDAIQHYGDYRHNTWLARLMMPFIGFPRTTIVGPIWLKFMTPEGGSLEAAFRSLLQHDFDMLLSAHGSFLGRGAHDAVKKAVDKAF